MFWKWGPEHTSLEKRQKNKYTIESYWIQRDTHSVSPACFIENTERKKV